MGWVKEVIDENPKVVTDYRGGKINALQFLLGQVIAKSKGRVEAIKVRKILEEKLG